MRPPESFIGQPVRSLQTMLRVIAQTQGKPRVIPDGLYGATTIAAVSAFQRAHGLPVTGVTDQTTWEAIVAEYIPALVELTQAEPLYILLNPHQVLRRGQKHPHIYLVQSILVVLSQAYGSISMPSVNGVLDEATADSLSTFQYLSNLPMTGQLDKQTWRQLALQYPLAASRAIIANL